MQSVFIFVDSPNADKLGNGPGRLFRLFAACLLLAMGYDASLPPLGLYPSSGLGLMVWGWLVVGVRSFYRWMGGVAEKEGVGQRRGIGYIPPIPSPLSLPLPHCFAALGVLA